MKADTSVGRQYITDLKTGRKFVVETLHNRGDVKDGDWVNGGIDAVKHRGSIAPEDSIITEENGFKNIAILPSNMNPQDYIDQLLNEPTNE